MARLSTIAAEKIEELTTTTKAKAFLGREFLTWLWYAADRANGELKLSNLNSDHTFEVRVWIDDRVVLESQSAQSLSHTIKGGDPAHSLEAQVALKQGKTVKELKLGLEIDGAGPFVVTLGSDGVSANGLAPKTLQLPRQDDEEDNTQPLASRITQIQHFNNVFDSLFRSFLDERLHAQWEKKTLPEIKSWIKNQPLEQSSVIH